LPKEILGQKERDAFSVATIRGVIKRGSAVTRA